MSSSYFSDLDEPQEDKAANSYFADLDEEPSRTRSILSAFPKGLIKGGAKFSPLPSFGPVSSELGERLTEKFLPTHKKGLEDVLEFSGEAAPLTFMGEGGLASKGLQALTGGLAKKGAKEINLPEWAQEIAGGVGMTAPSALKAAGSKALRPAAKQQAVFDFLKSKGISEKDITPIIQDKKMLSFLSKAAWKYDKDEPWLKGIKSQLGGMFENIREKGRSGDFLQGRDLLEFEKEFQDTVKKIPKHYQGLIRKPIKELMNNPVGFTDLHDFSKAINAIVKDVEGGKAAVGIMKGPIERAQARMNPELYRELKMTNEAYGKISNYVEKMTQKDWDSMINLGSAGGAILGLLTLNPVLLKPAAAALGIKISANQILSNPRLHNVHLKMWDAFRKHKMPQVLRLADILTKEMKKEAISGRANQENESPPPL